MGGPHDGTSWFIRKRSLLDLLANIKWRKGRQTWANSLLLCLHDVTPSLIHDTTGTFSPDAHSSLMDLSVPRTLSWDTLSFINYLICGIWLRHSPVPLFRIKDGEEFPLSLALKDCLSLMMSYMISQNSTFSLNSPVWNVFVFCGDVRR